MRLYSVHRPLTTPADAADTTRFVKEGFSWPAFFFTGIWLLWHRLWIEFILFAVVLGGAEFVVQSMNWPDGLSSLLSLAVALFLGFEGNDIRRWNLERRGFAEVAEVAAPDLMGAEHKFFSVTPEGAVTTAP